MRHVVLGFVAMLLIAPANAFDNASCSTFLVGTWVQGMGERDGETLTLNLTLRADGSAHAFASTKHKDGSTETKGPPDGPWTATPGSSVERCLLTVMPNTFHKAELSVVDDNTINIYASGRDNWTRQ